MRLYDENDLTRANNLTPGGIDDRSETGKTIHVQPPAMSWPVRDEYEFAIANWQHTVLDPDIRAGQLARDNHSIYTYGGANLYVCIYRVSDWMVRFFCYNPQHPTPGDIQERYRAIARFCDEHPLSCLLPVTYVERGIVVGENRVYPLVKMPFLANCPPLGEFIMHNYQRREVMQLLCDAWLRLIHELDEAQIAHGDLDLTNVLVQVQDQHLILKLIDYDNMWISALRGRAQTEYGHINFQHPYFMPPNARPYTQQMDRFSAMSIYISLRAITEYPGLYDEYGADEDDQLLFTQYDYLNAGLAGSRLQRIRDLNIPDLTPYLDELDDALKMKRMPCSLDTISMNGMHAIRTQRPSQPLAPSQALWGQAVYNASSAPPPPFSAPASFSAFTALPATPPIASEPAFHSPASPYPPFPWQRVTLNEPYNDALAYSSTEESMQPVVPTWLLITLIIVCILLLIAVVVIFVLILQRHGFHTPFTWHTTILHTSYARMLTSVRSNE